MSIIDLRKKLITKIQTTKDSLLLEELYQILATNEAEDSQVYKLSQEQQDAINEAREDVANGNYTTHKEVQNKVNQWLKK